MFVLNLWPPTSRLSGKPGIGHIPGMEQVQFNAEVRLIIELIGKLRALRAVCERSAFFATHEFVGAEKSAILSSVSSD